jgi:hypothetical protein
MICHVIGADSCPPLQGEHWRLSSVSAKRLPLAPTYPLKPSAENANRLVSAVGQSEPMTSGPAGALLHRDMTDHFRPEVDVGLLALA